LRKERVEKKRLEASASKKLAVKKQWKKEAVNKKQLKK
jgi:hypothetical protein